MPGRQPRIYLQAHLTQADSVFCTVYDFIDQYLLDRLAVDQEGFQGTVIIRPVPFCYFGQPPVQEIVDFVAPNDWRDYVLRNSHGVYASTAIPRTEAITHQYEGKERRAIGVQDGYYTRGTLVHEFFHYFSHAEFRRLFSGPEIEGLTEWLARRILGAGERHDIRGVGDFYAEELSPWDHALSDANLRLVLRAYVLGDATALAELRRLFQIAVLVMGRFASAATGGGKGGKTENKGME